MSCRQLHSHGESDGLSLSCISLCCIMSSRQLHSHGESDGLSLPERTRKSKKSSGQPKMDQQTSPQPSRPSSAQLPTGDSATPATSPAARTESTTPQATGLVQTPATHMDLFSRTGSPQIPLQNTQSPASHISPISGPLFTEDRLSTSSEQEICDQEVTTIIHENTPTTSTYYTIKAWIHCNSGLFHPRRSGPTRTLTCHGTSS